MSVLCGLVRSSQCCGLLCQLDIRPCVALSEILLRRRPGGARGFFKFICKTPGHAVVESLDQRAMKIWTDVLQSDFL